MKLTAQYAVPPHRYFGILEPSASLPDGLIVARTLSVVDNGLNVLRILNFTRADLALQPTKFLGQFYPVGEGEYDIVEALVSHIYTDLSPDIVIPADLSQTPLTAEQQQLARQL